ncbi:hypothetical protein [Amycolatopsis sp. NPDC051716]|uniref:hypothetical protein n=1 Tax=Amycolatopsis sp. NPDC051716 TaxID=3155804 RepID=UPI003432D21F
MAHEHAEHRQYESDFYAQTQQKLQQNVHHFGAEDQGDARAGVTPQTENQAAQYSVEQGKVLLHNQATRGDAPAPGQNYASSSHEELYGMVHDNMRPADLDDRGRVANKLGNWLADVSNAANDAVSSSEIQWQGPGAAQAHSFFQSTATYTGDTANAAQLSSNRYSQQAAAADYAQKNMPEPTGFNQQAEITKATVQYQAGDVAGATQTMTNVAAKQQQADAAHQQAVQVLQNLDSTYHETASTQPTYTPPPQLGQGDSTSVSGFHGTSGTGFSGTPSVGGTGPGTGPGGTSGSFAPGAPGGTGGTGGPSVTSGPGGPGTPSGTTYVPPGTSTGTGTFSGNSNFRATPAAGSFGRVTPDGLAMPGTTTGGTSGSGDVTRGKGIGSGRAGTGFAGSRVSGSAGTGPKEAPGEGGSKTGSKPGERLERGATAAAAAKGGKGGSGAAGAAGAGKKKDDDKEHKNKYAVDEEVFDLKPERGPDGEKIVKPTIGETS